mmetsp:Transcript_22530/g.54469  ORF Transcript_22530/g.54469 Transcript_22530/m.54469 type:complete len:165 (+) Transcript_22530:54-548(+)
MNEEAMATKAKQPPSEAAMHLETQQQLDKPVHQRHRNGRNVPFAISYFTKMAEDEKVRRRIESRKHSLENMSTAHRYFEKKAMETEKTNKRQVAIVDGMAIDAPRPAAMEHFAAKEAEAHANKKVQFENSSSAQRPAAMEHFASKRMGTSMQLNVDKTWEVESP